MKLRGGAESARIVAKELDRAAEHLNTRANVAITESAAPPPEAHTEHDANNVQAQAFRDLEGDVCDLDRMGQIAQGLIAECGLAEDGATATSSGQLT